MTLDNLNIMKFWNSSKGERNSLMTKYQQLKICHPGRTSTLRLVDENKNLDFTHAL